MFHSIYLLLSYKNYIYVLIAASKSPYPSKKLLLTSISFPYSYSSGKLVTIVSSLIIRTIGSSPVVGIPYGTY